MRTGSSLFQSAVVGLFTLFAAIPAIAAIPGGNDPKAYTSHDYLRGKRDFAKRMFVEGYKSVGKHDPKWDASVIKFLDAFCTQFAYGNADPLFRDDKMFTTEQMIAFAREADDAKCDDPLFKFIRAFFSADKTDFRATMEKSLPGIIERKYPPYVIAAMTREILGIRPTISPADRLKYGQLDWDQTIASLTGKVPDTDLRYLIEGADSIFTAASVDKKLEFCKAIEQSKETSPWLINVLRGEYEIRAAWQARGAGWATTVGQDAWTNFYAHLSAARDYLAKAQSLHPEFPEAATKMISVAMGNGPQLNEKERDWFDKAAKAQLDYEPAYSAYIWSIYPRWGGSHKEMFSFGLECLATQRFDTVVPMELLMVVKDIDNDISHDLTTYSVPYIQAAVRQFLNQAAEKAPTEYARNYFGSYHVALSWRTNEFKDAAAALDKIGDHLQLDAFQRVGGWAPGAISQIRAMNTTYAEKIAKAQKESEEGDFDSATFAFSNVSSKLPKDDPSQLFLKFRIKSMEYQKSFLAGDWVTIDPTSEFAPWAVVTGDFKIDADGATIATANKKGVAMLLCRTQFWDAYELKVKLDSPDPKNPSTPTVFVQSNEKQYTSAGIETVKSTMFVKSFVIFGGKPQSGPVKLTDDDEMHFLLPPPDNGRHTMTVKFNAKEFGANVPIPNDVSPDNAFVGIGIEGTVPGSVARFREIRIKRVMPPKN